MKNLKINYQKTSRIQLLLFLLIVVTFYPTTEALASRISSSCTSSNSLDVRVVGIHKTGSKTIPGLSNKVKKVIVECTCRGLIRNNPESTCPTAITFTVNGKNISVPRVRTGYFSTWWGKYIGEYEGDMFIYRLSHNATVTSLKYNAPSSSSHKNGMRGLTAWIVNNDPGKANQPQSIYIDEFHYQHPARAFNIPIKAANAARNMTIHLPVSEIQDSGFTRYRAVALNASGTVVATRGNKDFKGGNNASEIRWDKLVFNGVPGNATQIRVWIESPQHEHGTSFMIGSIAVTSNQQKPTITCPASKTVACASEIKPGNATYKPACPDDKRKPTVSGPVISGQDNCPYTKYTYTHSVGAVSCKQVFTIANNAAPSIACAANIKVVCEDDINPVFPEFSTSCGTNVTKNISEPIVEGTPGCPGTTYTYTYTLTDACGRVATCKQVFEIGEDCISNGICFSSSCEDFTNAETIVEGIKGKYAASISLGENSSGAIVECICRFRYDEDGDCPASITLDILKPNGSVIRRSVEASAIKPSSDPRYPSKIYRFEYDAPVSKITYKNNISVNSMRSFVVWKLSESLKPNLPNFISADQFFFNRYESDTDSKSYKIKVPSSYGTSRNFTIDIPVADHGNNDRIIQYIITAYSGDQKLKTKDWKITRDNDFSEIRLDQLKLEEVDGSVTHIEVNIQSIAQGNIVGASLNIGSILVTSNPCCIPVITCPATIDRISDEGTCNYTVQGNEFDPIVEEGCPAKLSNSFNGEATLAGASFPKGTTTITWKASGGLAYSLTVVTVTDDETCPESTCTVAYNYDENTCSCKESVKENDCNDYDNCTEDYVDETTCACVNEVIEGCGGCTNYPGFMPYESHKVCYETVVEVSETFSTVAENNVKTYVMHEGKEFDGANYIAINDKGEFTNAGLDYTNRPLYISVVIGPPNQFGRPDFNDMCTVYSPYGACYLFYDPITVNVLNETCVDGAYSVEISLSGGAGGLHPENAYEYVFDAINFYQNVSVDQVLVSGPHTGKEKYTVLGLDVEGCSVDHSCKYVCDNLNRKAKVTQNGAGIFILSDFDADLNIESAEVFNVNGQQIPAAIQINPNSCEVELSNQPMGMYFAQLLLTDTNTGQSFITSEKLVKQ